MDGAGASWKKQEHAGPPPLPAEAEVPRYATVLAIGRSDAAFPWRSKIGVTGSRLGDQ